MIKEYRGKGIVAFIDLLGFSSEITNRWNDLDTDSNPLNRLLKIREFVEDYLNESFNHTFLTGTKEQITKQVYGKVISISDSFTILIPIESDSSPNEIMSKILSISGSIYELWRKCIKEGFSIRGGVDFGEIYWSDFNVVGPAFISAYLIESKIAQTSRIVFSNSIKELIRNIRPDFNPEFEDYLKIWFISDFDSHLILNPINMFGYDNTEELKEGISKLKEIRDKSHIKFHCKYIDLLNILENPEIQEKNESKFNNIKFNFN